MYKLPFKYACERKLLPEDREHREALSRDKRFKSITYLLYRK